MSTLKTELTASHNRLILKWLENGLTLSQAGAFQQWGCFRLGARIWDLKRPPFNREIKTEMVSFVNTITGNRGRFAVYSLIQKTLVP